MGTWIKDLGGKAQRVAEIVREGFSPVRCDVGGLFTLHGEINKPRQQIVPAGTSEKFLWVFESLIHIQKSTPLTVAAIWS